MFIRHPQKWILDPQKGPDPLFGKRCPNQMVGMHNYRKKRSRSRFRHLFNLISRKIVI